MSQSGSADARLSQVQFPELDQALEMDQPGIADLRTIKVEVLQPGQVFQVEPDWNRGAGIVAWYQTVQVFQVSLGRAGFVRGCSITEDHEEGQQPWNP